MADENNDNNTPTIDENAESPITPETSAIEEVEAEQPLTAVALGLIPEVFVSQVSTQLHFYAP